MTGEKQDSAGFLGGVRVLELADERGEYCGKVLAGLGADVIKIEPPEGESTRSYGPFFEDVADRDRSLYFWHFNFGKRGVTLDLDTTDGQESFRRLAASADVVIDGRPFGWLAERGIDYDALKAINPGIIIARISPFGDEGPWKDYKGADIVHLALGGMMNNCGYDPDPNGFYDTPPIAPQMWQAYQVGGEMAVMGILSALYNRANGGAGQSLSVPIHWSNAQATERDVPSWVFLHQLHQRYTCRHSTPVKNPPVPVLAPTKDGRYMFPYRSYAHGGNEIPSTIAILDKYGAAEDLTDPKYQDPAYLAQPGVSNHIGDVVQRFVLRWKFDRDVWRDFQDAGMTWSPVRKPEENAVDAHWLARETFFEVEHPELGRSFTEVGARWYCGEVPWRRGPRAPLLGEHNGELLWAAKVAATPKAPPPTASRSGGGALDGVKILDLGWLVASAGAGRFLAAQGADVVKVEHKSRWDGMRHPMVIVPEGGRAAREAATVPLPDIKANSPNRSGFFMDINAGKRGIGLNVKAAEGRELLARMIEKANVIAEGYSPGTMDRMGFGYERMKELNPSIVYVQQSGMGQHGTYGGLRSYGPVAQAFSGLSEMSGLPEPYPPAGIGYSYLDWFGAWNMADAILAGLYRQKMTGQGCWIDACQVEVGTYLSGTAVLDWSANGRSWSRYGNASPYKPAAPHGVYRTRGTDRWVAIACFTQDEWQALRGVLGNPAWGGDPRFATLEGRMAHSAELDALVTSATVDWEPYVLMQALQVAGVAAGVNQTAEDRVENDPQLKHDGWLVDLKQSEIGIWPAKEMPVRFSETPARVGGAGGRHGPSYAEDNEAVYGEWLGLGTDRIRALQADGVI